MADFDRVCVYVDSHFKAVDSFTVSDTVVAISVIFTCFLGDLVQGKPI